MEPLCLTGPSVVVLVKKRKGVNCELSDFAGTVLLMKKIVYPTIF